MENKIQLNKVKNRFLFISPSVQNGLEAETKITDFDLLEKLGEGSFGKVYRAKHKKTAAIYAIKFIDKLNKNNQEGKPYFRREIEIMYKVRHPNIVRLYGHFEDDQFCYFVLEYIPKGNLYTILSKQKTKTFDAVTTANFIRDLVCSIYYLHNMDPPIIHRDIKPENVLLNEQNKIKLTDFGWSNYVEDTSIRSTYCGTPVYLAPEMIKEIGHDENLDIWCIGILMFELLTGNIPFQGSDQQILNGNILRNRIMWPKDMDLSAKDVISKILRTDPTERISLVEMLKHPFFLKNVCKPTENFYKPSDETEEEKATYILCKDTPANFQKQIIKKKEGTPQESPKSVPTEGNSNNNSTVILEEKELNSTKLSVDQGKIIQEYNKLKEKYHEINKKFDDLQMKQNYFNLEKNQLIKEREDIESQKLEYQKQLGELKQTLFEYENKIRLLKNEISIKDNRLITEGREIDKLTLELEEIKFLADEERKIAKEKLNELEKRLSETIDHKESKLGEEIDNIRNSMRVVYDENERDRMNSIPFGNNREFEDRLKLANDELTDKLNDLKNDFSQEKAKFNIILRNKDDEIKRLINERNTKKDSDNKKLENFVNRYENTLKLKDSEIENLKAKIKKLENLVSVAEMKNK